MSDPVDFTDADFIAGPYPGLVALGGVRHYLVANSSESFWPLPTLMPTRHWAHAASSPSSPNLIGQPSTTCTPIRCSIRSANPHEGAVAGD